MGEIKNLLKISVSFIKKPIRLYQIAGSYNSNAYNMTFGFPKAHFFFSNTFAGVINGLRDRGYASNQVDYIAHSMGGVVGRYAIEKYKNIYYKTGGFSHRDYKNYEKGYIHKMITLASPHNNSPLADIAYRYSDEISLRLRFLLTNWYNFNPDAFPFWFYQFDNLDVLIPTFKATDAVTNLQVNEERGGINLASTDIRAHLIAGDFIPGTQNGPSDIDQAFLEDFATAIGEYKDYFDFLDILLKLTIANENNRQLVEDILEIRGVSDEFERYNYIYRGLKYIERITDFLQIGLQIPESDLVVSINSQLANYPKTADNVSVFDNYVAHAFIRKIVANQQVGNRVNDLLDLPTESSFFAPIPSTTNRKGTIDWPHLPSSSIISRSDTNKIKISNPSYNTIVFTDSIVKVEISLLDTISLINIDLRFQGATYPINSRQEVIKLDIPVQSNLLDGQILELEAMYYYGDSTLFVLDTIALDVQTQSEYLDFSVSPTLMYLFKDQTDFPTYQAIFNNFLTVGNFSPEISAEIKDSDIVTFDNVSKGFRGLQAGETNAIISYKGLTDTLYFVVEELPDTTTTNIDSEPWNQELLNQGQIQVYPNPFEDQTTLVYKLNSPQKVSLHVYSLQGVKLKTLLENKWQQNGIHTIRFGRKELPAGVYIGKLETENSTETVKMVILN